MSAAARRRSPPGEPLLEIEDLRTAYGRIEALKGISLEVHEGEIVTLIGSNGAGKTTTLRTINGIVAPRGGKITLRGRRTSRTARRTTSSSSASRRAPRAAACSRA